MLGVLTVSLSNSVTILSDGVTILQKNICQQRFRLNPHKNREFDFISLTVPI